MHVNGGSSTTLCAMHVVTAIAQHSHNEQNTTTAHPKIRNIKKKKKCHNEVYILFIMCQWYILHRVSVTAH